jgi:hypothetical protein
LLQSPHVDGNFGCISQSSGLSPLKLPRFVSIHPALAVVRVHGSTYVACSAPNMLISHKTYCNNGYTQVSPKSCTRSTVKQRLHHITPEARLAWLPQVQEWFPQPHPCQRRRDSSVSNPKTMHNLQLTYGSCQKNAKDSGLLRLPPEIHTMIGGFALGGQTIKLAYKGLSPHDAIRSDDRFPLLSVCHQVYAEAAMLP